MLKTLTLTVLLAFIFTPALSQGWKKTYLTGNGDQVLLADVKSLPGGGIIACGSASNTGLENAVLLRCNDQGDVIWAKEYNAALSENAGKVALYPGGGYVLWINELDTNSLNDYNVIVRTDTAGNILWQYNFIGNGIYTLEDLEVSPSGKIFFTGNTAICPSSFGCGYTAALSGSGILLWATSVESNLLTSFHDMIFSSDYHIVAAGAVLDSISFADNGFVAKIDTNGVLAWANTFSGSFTSDKFYAVTENNDLQGYVMAGSLLSSPNDEFDALVVTCNYSGNFQSGGYAGTAEADEFRNTFTLSGTDIFLGGYSSVNSGLNVVPQGLNVQVDISNGNLSNGSLLGVPADDEYVQAAVPGNGNQLVQITSKNPFSITGRADFLLAKSITPGSVCNENPVSFTPNLVIYINAFGADTASLLLTAGGVTLNTAALLVTDADGCVNIGISENHTNLRMHLYPNPANDLVLLSRETKEASTVSITDLKGAEVLRQQISGERALIDVRHLPSGVYSVQWLNNSGNTVRKLIVQH